MPNLADKLEAQESAAQAEEVKPKKVTKKKKKDE